MEILPTEAISRINLCGPEYEKSVYIEAHRPYNSVCKLWIYAFTLTYKHPK